MFLQFSSFTLTIISFVATIMALAIAAPFHEFAHAYAAKREGDYTAVALKRYTLCAHAHFDVFGFICLFLCGFGWAKPVPVDSRNFKRGKKSEFIVSIAGILTNLILGIVFMFLFYLIQKLSPNFYFESNFGLLLYYFLNISVSLNFMLAFFNLLPIYPLDGYRIIDSFSKTDNAFLKFMRSYSIFIYLILIISGLFTELYYGTMVYLINGLSDLFILILGL